MYRMKRENERGGYISGFKRRQNGMKWIHLGQGGGRAVVEGSWWKRRRMGGGGGTLSCRFIKLGSIPQGRKEGRRNIKEGRRVGERW
jgi:hypothetical protein